MTIQAFRILKTRFLHAAFDGEGARLYGGRWNSIGTPMVYASESLSLATLELLVHLGDATALKDLFSWIRIEFSPKLVHEISVDSLNPSWGSLAIIPETQVIGDTWVREMRSAVLRVPSVVTPNESNYLLNPAHVDFSKITIHPHESFKPDSRLVR